METETAERTPILEIAWKRFTIFDAAARQRTKWFYRIRKIILWASVAATAFAILTTVVSADAPAVLRLGVKFFFVATPIVASVIAAFATRFYSNGSWLIMRAGAEEIKKEIYLYRTIRDKSNRDEVLESRLAAIQRQMYQNLNGEFSFVPYDGELPPYYKPNEKDENKRGDPGFNDLTGEEYFRFRLQDQLEWHNKKINEYQTKRLLMVIFILGMGGLGAIIAAWGESLSILVAFTAAITTALIGWQELNNYDAVIGNYSKVVMELTLLYDHWMRLQPEVRNQRGQEFEMMVDKCETVLWAQQKEYTRLQQEVVQETQKEIAEKAKLAEDLLAKAQETSKAAEKEVREAVFDAASQAMDTGKEKLVEDFKTTLGTLAAEASSELVQQELEAMRNAITEMVESVVGDKSSLFASLAEIAEQFSNTDIGRDTTREELNLILASYPKTGEIKG